MKMWINRRNDQNKHDERIGNNGQEDNSNNKNKKVSIKLKLTFSNRFWCISSSQWSRTHNNLYGTKKYPFFLWEFMWKDFIVLYTNNIVSIFLFLLLFFSLFLLDSYTAIRFFHFFHIHIWTHTQTHDHMNIRYVCQ